MRVVDKQRAVIVPCSPRCEIGLSRKRFCGLPDDDNELRPCE